MAVKYQMTRQGMESMYTLAWRQRPGRQPKIDPMFSGYGVDQSDEQDEDVTLLEEAVVSPSRTSSLEQAVRSAAERDRVLSRRVLDLVRLGYTGM